MPIDPYAGRFLERLAAFRAPAAAAPTVAERRAALENLFSFAGRREPVGHVEDRELPGPGGTLRIRIYTPADGNASLAPRRLPALLYLHGGGLVAGDLRTHDGIARSLANASGARLIALEYRLAPEHRFPAALEDGYAAARWIAAHAESFAIDPERLCICGDSAGATVAAAVCQRAAERDEVRIALQLLICPILDHRDATASRRRFSEGYFLDAATLEQDLALYLGSGVDRADPRVSPGRTADVSRLPPTSIHTAELDPVRDEGEAYARRLQSAGVRTLYRSHSGMIHLFYGMGALIPHAAVALQMMGADIRALLGAGAPREEAHR